MSEETLIRQCAPTLAGIKTGSLFTCPCQDENALKEEIKEYNRSFVPKGLCMIPLRFEKGKALIYLFRPSGLKHDFQNQLARHVLAQFGYPEDSPKQWIACLVRRFRQGLDFPHEIGLFLSYPPEDLKGFMDNHAANYKYSGIWKVYGDVNKAQSLFHRYKQCTETYCRLWQKGSCIEQLAVSD